MSSYIENNDANIRTFISNAGNELQSNVLPLISELEDDIQEVVDMDSQIQVTNNQGPGNAKIAIQTNHFVRWL